MVASPLRALAPDPHVMPQYGAAAFALPGTMSPSPMASTSAASHEMTFFMMHLLQDPSGPGGLERVLP